MRHKWLVILLSFAIGIFLTMCIVIFVLLDDHLSIEETAISGLITIADDYTRRVAISPDNTLIATGGKETVYIYNYLSKSLVKTLGLSKNDTVQDIVWSLDGSLLGVAYTNANVEIWNTKNWLLELKAQAPFDIDPELDLTQLAFNPKNELLASTLGSLLKASDSKWYLWRVQAKPTVKLLGTTTASMVFNRDRSLLAGIDRRFQADSAMIETTITLWNLATETIVWEKSYQGSLNDRSMDAAQYIFSCNYYQHCKRLAISSSNNLIAFGTSYGTIEVWDFAKNELKYTIRAYTNRTGNIYFDPSGNTLISMSDYQVDDPIPGDEYIKLWDATTGKGIKKLKGVMNLPTDLSFSTKEKTFITANSTSEITFWKY